MESTPSPERIPLRCLKINMILIRFPYTNQVVSSNENLSLLQCLSNLVSKRKFCVADTVGSVPTPFSLTDRIPKREICKIGAHSFLRRIGQGARTEANQRRAIFSFRNGKSRSRAAADR